MGEVIPELSYAEFEKRVAAQNAARHVPLSGQFELTYRCNFECVHCYEQGMREQKELSTERWIALVDEVADQGCLWLTLTGGEAVMHPGFERIYEHAVRRGLLVTVFSNGSLLTERIAQLFRRLPPRTIEVSLYGASAETYARSTGRAKGYELALAGVRRMVADGHQVQLKTVVFDETAEDFEAIRALAKELGTGFRYDTNLHAALDGGRAPLAHRLAPEKIIDVEATDPRGFELLRQKFSAGENVPSDKVYRCGAGRLAFAIAPDGFMQLCTIVRSLRFVLSKTSFGDAWAAMGREVQRRYESEKRRCSTCELQFMCGTCPGVAELEMDDVEAAIDHICETTHARASAALGRTIVPRWKQQRAQNPAKLAVLGQGESHANRSSGCAGGCSGCPSAALHGAGH
jgi:radical SAM protein with 4Fe4S-binding SPASM domain